MLADQLVGVIRSASSLRDIDHTAKLLWRAYGAGHVDDAAASSLGAAIEARRREIRGAGGGNRPEHTGRSSALPCPGKRHRLRSPDRQRSIERRRRLAASGPMPPGMAARFTQGELAALRIVADEVAANGACAKTLGEVAARAGVCESTARNAVRQAARLGLVTVEERRRPGCRNLPNIVRIISPEWSSWLRARVRRPIGFKKPEPTDTSEERRDSQERDCRFRAGVRDAAPTASPRCGGGRS